MRNESEWLEELLWIRRRSDQMRGWWTMTWMGHVQEMARDCSKQFPAIGQAMLDCLEEPKSSDPIIRKKEDEEWIEWQDVMIEISIDPMVPADDGWLGFDIWDAGPGTDGEWLGSGMITDEDWDKFGPKALRPYAEDKRNTLTMEDYS